MRGLLSGISPSDNGDPPIENRSYELKLVMLLPLMEKLVEDPNEAVVRWLPVDSGEKDPLGEYQGAGDVPPK